MVYSSDGKKHIESGVIGLDDLMHGGFVFPQNDGLILLIKGKPGTGKTTLALKIAHNVAQEIYKSGINPDYADKPVWSYFTCEQRKEDIVSKCSDFGYEVDKESIFDYDFPSDNPFPADPHYADSQSTLTWANNVLLSHFDETCEDKVRRQNVIVMDGLNMMGTEERVTFNMSWLISRLRKYSKLSILVYEPLEGEAAQIDSMADMIFQLKGEEFNGPPLYYLNKISITKSRLQSCGLGWHQYKIFNDKGLVIFPSIHFYIHKSNFFAKEYDESKNTWYDSIVSSQTSRNNYTIENSDSIIAALLHNKLKYGSFTVLLGPRKTCKTLLSIDFLKDGSRHSDAGLLVSLIDNRETIINNIRNTFGTNNDNELRKDCSANHLFHFRPGCITSNEFFHYLDEQMTIHGSKPKRFVLWDLAQIDFSYPLISNDTMFFPALIDYLKNPNTAKEDSSILGRSETASVIIGTYSCKLAKSAFTMADNVILLLRDKYKNEECIYAYVDRIEGEPGIHSLWRIPLDYSAAGSKRGRRNAVSQSGDICKQPVLVDELDVELKTRLNRAFDDIITNIENRVC